MSIIESKTDEELREEFKELEASMNEQDRDYNKRRIMSWVASGALHMTMLLIMGTFVYTTMEEEVELPPIHITSVIPMPRQIDNKPSDPKEFDPINVVEHDQEVTSDKTIVSDIDLMVTELSSEEVDTPVDQPKGREEAVSTSEVGGDGAFLAIGPGGGGGGIFGKRIGGGDKRTIGRAFGPHSKGVVTSLDNALRWLKRHQSQNGMWSAQNYFAACVDEGPKCEPGREIGGGDEAMTGYAVLCFLGAGYDHKTPNKYRDTVKRGVNWIIANQDKDGLIGKRNYEHPIAAMALVEAYAMTNDPELRQPAQKSVDIMLNRQSKNANATDSAYATLGWDYINPNANRNDSSVTGWNVMALKSAVAAGLNVGQGIEGSKKWLEGAWKAANPNWAKLSDPYKDTSVFPYTWNASTGSTEKDHLSFIGALCAVFMGHRDGDPMLTSLLNDMDKRWLDTGNWKKNAYCIYYASLAAFQSGDHWLKWREAYVPHLIQTQWGEADGACKSGTWNYGPQAFHGADTSRVLIHCYYTLALQVATRYDQVNKKK